MADLTETLATMRRNLQRHEGPLEDECDALLCAVEGVVAVCEPCVSDTRGLPAFQAGERGMATAVVKALTDALGGM